MTDDRLTSTDITRMLGITPELWRQWRHRGKAPQSDGYHDRRTPYWLRSTIETWQETRNTVTVVTKFSKVDSLDELEPGTYCIESDTDEG